MVTKNDKGGGKSGEFEEFLSMPEVTPPAKMTEQVMTFVQAKLNPPIGWVIFKLTMIYALTGLIVLLFCPQFGIRLLAEHGLLHWFALLGAYGCELACGAVFLGSGTAVASLILRPEELRRIRPTRFVYFVSFGLLALVIFVGVGAEIVLSLAMAWLVGSIGGEAVAFELCWRLRASTASTK